MGHQDGMKRREFLQTTAAGAAVAAGGTKLASVADAAAKGKRPPNILFIMSDEHQADIMGPYGDKIVRTPNLDKLAAGGITFDQCYTNSPLCVPCRLSFTAGKYVSRVGAWSNDCWLPGDDIPSIARAMTAAGYDSLLCGKQHYDGSRRYGFTEIEKIGNNSFKTGKGGRRKADDLTPKPGLSGRFEQFYPSSESGVLTHDRKVTAGVQKFLAARRASDKPFFLFAGYLAPHFPLIVAQKFWDTYKDKVPMPNIPQGHLEGQARNWKHLRIGFNMENVPDDIVKKGRELYYGLTEWFDKQVGIILDALNKSGLAENTIVMYTTDHGENLGEHGLWWKNAAYDTATRVPMIVHWPRRWKGGQRRKGACSHVDVVQTLVELSGGKAPKDWDGDSLVEWMDSPEAEWKDRAVAEYYAHNICSGYAMIRSGRYKYVYHTKPDSQHEPERELYDMEADPGEFTNLAGLSEHAARIRQLEADLIEELGEHPEKTELRCRADYARTYGRKKPGRGRKK